MTIRILLRDFDTARLAEKAELLRATAHTIEAEFPRAKVDVTVMPQYRNMAEGLARERGLPEAGIGVGVDNPRAAALYARLGYRPLLDYLDRYSYEDVDGTMRECVDACTFLVKELL